MLANNNHKIIGKLSKRALLQNRSYYGVLLLTVLLATFMLFSVFTVGSSYFKLQKQQNLRLNGADFDAILYGVTETQRMKMEEDPIVSDLGILAIAGWVDSTPFDETPNVTLVWADDNYWQNMMKPIRTKFQGRYPENEDEVLVTEKVLNRCGYSGLKLGDTITVSYEDNFGFHEKNMCIVGIWEGYGSFSRDSIFVSRSFYNTTGKTFAGVDSGRCVIRISKPWMSSKEQEDFIAGLDLGKAQRFFFLSDYSYALLMVFGMIGLALVICLCAYLLIFNVQNLAVDRQIRSLGLLQTVGMTERQIKAMLKRQWPLLGTAGTLLGLICGAVFSYLLIPAVVGSLGIHRKTVGEISASFSPWMALLAVLLTLGTLWIGSRKALKTASMITPLAAMGYGYRCTKRNLKKRGKGNLLSRFSREQLSRDKKKTAVVMVSLGVTLSVFLCLSTLLASQSARAIVGNAMDYDLVVNNDTLAKENHDQWQPLLDEELADELRGLSGVKAVYPLYSSEITVPWEPEVADTWMREFYETWMTETYEDALPEYKSDPENFGSFLMGVPDEVFDALNAELTTPIDKADFLAGKTCLLYRNGLAFDDDVFQGKTITVVRYGESSRQASYEIAGFCDESYFTSPLIGCPPVVIVSEKALKRFDSQPYCVKLGIYYEKSYDASTENSLLKILNGEKYKENTSYDSKLESLKEVQTAQGPMAKVGAGIVVLLALIAVLNYVNTVISNMQNCREEFAILESIGMTERQQYEVLLLEGLFYGIGAILFTATVGLAVTYLIFHFMNYLHTDFFVPILPVIAMVLFSLILCMVIPLIAGRQLLYRGTVVERLHRRE